MKCFDVEHLSIPKLYREFDLGLKMAACVRACACVCVCLLACVRACVVCSYEQQVSLHKACVKERKNGSKKNKSSVRSVLSTPCKKVVRSLQYSEDALKGGMVS